MSQRGTPREVFWDEWAEKLDTLLASDSRPGPWIVRMRIRLVNDGWRSPYDEPWTSPAPAGIANLVRTLRQSFADTVGHPEPAIAYIECQMFHDGEAKLVYRKGAYLSRKTLAFENDDKTDRELYERHIATLERQNAQLFSYSIDNQEIMRDLIISQADTIRSLHKHQATLATARAATGAGHDLKEIGAMFGLAVLVFSFPAVRRVFGIPEDATIGDILAQLRRSWGGSISTPSDTRQLTEVPRPTIEPLHGDGETEPDPVTDDSSPAMTIQELIDRIPGQPELVEAFIGKVKQNPSAFQSFKDVLMAEYFKGSTA